MYQCMVGCGVGYCQTTACMCIVERVHYGNYKVASLLFVDVYYQLDVGPRLYLNDERMY